MPLPLPAWHLTSSKSILELQYNSQEGGINIMTRTTKKKKKSAFLLSSTNVECFATLLLSHGSMSVGKHATPENTEQNI